MTTVSILSKLKSMPTSYWVVGLGAAALGVDYLVEGESSIVSSIWRGVTGGGRGEAEAAPVAPGPRRGGARMPSTPGAPAQPVVLPSPTPGLEYLVVPYYDHHRHRRYYPAHEPHHARERHFRNWPRRGYLPTSQPQPHPGHEEHRLRASHEDQRFHAGHFDWEA